MQRVLVDDLEAVVGLGDEVAIVDLQRAAAQTRPWRRRRRRLSAVGRACDCESPRSRTVGTAARRGGAAASGSPKLPRPNLRRRDGSRHRSLLARAAPSPNATSWLDAAAGLDRHRRRRAAGQVSGRRAAGREVGRQELRPQRAEQLAVEPAAVLEADFLLRGMHVDVDQLGRHVEPQEANRLPAREQQAAVGLAERVLQRAVADRAAVEEQVLHPAGRRGCASGWRRSRRA